jgi:hypothetical protein
MLTSYSVFVASVSSTEGNRSTHLDQASLGDLVRKSAQSVVGRTAPTLQAPKLQE